MYGFKLLCYKPSYRLGSGFESDIVSMKSKPDRYV